MVITPAFAVHTAERASAATYFVTRHVAARPRDTGVTGASSSEQVCDFRDRLSCSACCALTCTLRLTEVNYNMHKPHS